MESVESDLETDAEGNQNGMEESSKTDECGKDHESNDQVETDMDDEHEELKMKQQQSYDRFSLDLTDEATNKLNEMRQRLLPNKISLDMSEDFDDTLPEGWIALKDDVGTPYHHNKDTGVTQWEMPQ